MSIVNIMNLLFPLIYTCPCVHVYMFLTKTSTWPGINQHFTVMLSLGQLTPPHPPTREQNKKKTTTPPKIPYKLTFYLKLHIPFSSIIHHILSSSGSCSHYFNARPLESFSDAPRQRFSIIFWHEEEYQPANLVFTLTYLLPFLSLYC